MKYNKQIYILIVIGVLFILLDSVYLYSIKDMLENQIASVQRVSVQFRISGAIICYLLLTIVLYYFIILPQRPITDAFWLGILIYGVYETTNYAVLKKWKPEIVAIDTLWGGVLLALVTSIVYKFTPLHI